MISDALSLRTIFKSETQFYGKVSKYVITKSKIFQVQK